MHIAVHGLQRRLLSLMLTPLVYHKLIIAIAKSLTEKVTNLQIDKYWCNWLYIFLFKAPGTYFDYLTVQLIIQWNFYPIYKLNIASCSHTWITNWLPHIQNTNYQAFLLFPILEIIWISVGIIQSLIDPLVNWNASKLQTLVRFSQTWTMWRISVQSILGPNSYGLVTFCTSILIWETRFLNTYYKNVSEKKLEITVTSQQWA